MDRKSSHAPDFFITAILPLDSDGQPCRYLNYYRCDECDVEWTDEWSCMCDDECPSCGADISPYDADDRGNDDISN